jgi:ATP-dependent RNA helicase RhlE
MPAEIARLAGEILHEPERVEITARTVAVERVEQYVHHLSAAGKRDRLTELLRSGDFSRVIVFTRTKRGADQVVKRLAAAGIDAEALHGNKSQNVRQRTLSNFRGGKTRILVATDIASRGIDVDGVTHVINYELPHEPESYVHRIGRTARAGASGIAISFCDPGERTQLRAIERLVRQALRVVGDSGAPSSDAPDRAVDNTSPRARSGRSRRNSRRFERRAA